MASRPAKRVPAKPAKKEPTVVAVPAAQAPAAEPKRTPREPVWLVRIVLVLFLVGFASFLARELWNFRAWFLAWLS